MSVIDWKDCPEHLSQHLINYIRRHLEHTEEIELCRLWMGEEDYRTRWYTIPINALTPQGC